MPAIVAFVGLSNSGKTTLIEKLIRELNSRGYHVATIKHAGHGTSLDEPGKDSFRHIQAGSEATIVFSEDRALLIKPVTPNVSLEEIARLFGEDPDIIIAEGFKQSDVPKIEVHRKEIGPPLKDLKKLIAIATDEPLETKTRQFSLEDVKPLADFIETGFIAPQSERISLYINETPITLTKFPKEIITNIMMALAASLKGAGPVTSLKLFLKKRE
ncbi:MAG: molybdopterin-guanine dinucleotide biosynthesis protein B [Chloroflexi bacterium]|nr:molybdopterin-guanine dinucleotide biosynthesis protein B [Chloroflexota bacterium]